MAENKNDAPSGGSDLEALQRGEQEREANERAYQEYLSSTDASINRMNMTLEQFTTDLRQKKAAEAQATTASIEAAKERAARAERAAQEVKEMVEKAAQEVRDLEPLTAEEALSKTTANVRETKHQMAAGVKETLGQVTAENKETERQVNEGVEATLRQTQGALENDTREMTEAFENDLSLANADSDTNPEMKQINEDLDADVTETDDDLIHDENEFFGTETPQGVAATAPGKSPSDTVSLDDLTAQLDGALQDSGAEGTQAGTPQAGLNKSTVAAGLAGLAGGIALGVALSNSGENDTQNEPIASAGEPTLGGSGGPDGPLPPQPSPALTSGPSPDGDKEILGTDESLGERFEGKIFWKSDQRKEEWKKFKDVFANAKTPEDLIEAGFFALAALPGRLMAAYVDYVGAQAKEKDIFIKELKKALDSDDLTKLGWTNNQKDMAYDTFVYGPTVMQDIAETKSGAKLMKSLPKTEEGGLDFENMTTDQKRALGEEMKGNEKVRARLQKCIEVIHNRVPSKEDLDRGIMGAALVNRGNELSTEAEQEAIIQEVRLKKTKAHETYYAGDVSGDQEIGLDNDDNNGPPPPAEPTLGGPNGPDVDNPTPPPAGPTLGGPNGPDVDNPTPPPAGPTLGGPNGPDVDNPTPTGPTPGTPAPNKTGNEPKMDGKTAPVVPQPTGNLQHLNLPPIDHLYSKAQNAKNGVQDVLRGLKNLNNIRDAINTSRGGLQPLNPIPFRGNTAAKETVMDPR